MKTLTSMSVVGAVVCAPVAGGLLASNAVAAGDGTITALFTEIAGNPLSIVPAGADVPEGTMFQAFDRPFRSANGMNWAVVADTDLATSEDDVLILSTPGAMMVIAREGTGFGAPTEGELLGPIDETLSVTDAGGCAFLSNTDGPTSADEHVILFDGATFTVGAREGDEVPGFPDDVLGSTLDSPSYTDAGLAYRAPSTVGTLGTDFDDFVILGGAALLQEATDIPGGQMGGAMEAWDAFDTNDSYVTADGLHYLVQGDLTGDTTIDDVAVVDGTVVVQEGEFLAGSGFTSPVGAIAETTMTPNGDWFVRGDNADDQDWVVGNGDVIAMRDAPIAAGKSETFSDAPYAACFFWMSADGSGNSVVGGTTSNADADHDAVLVLNGTTVLARQGDQVDVDGDGALDDAYINVFNNDDGVIDADGVLTFSATLRTSKLADLGQAILRLDTNAFAPCAGDIAPVPADGVVDTQDLLTLLANWGLCPEPCETSCTGDTNGDCSVDTADLLELLGGWGDC